MNCSRCGACADVCAKGAVRFRIKGTPFTVHAAAPRLMFLFAAWIFATMFGEHRREQPGKVFRIFRLMGENMKRIIALGSLGAAILTILFALALPIKVMPLFLSGVGALDLKIAPWFSGGEVAFVLDRGAYQVKVYRPVYPALVGDRGAGICSAGLGAEERLACQGSGFHRFGSRRNRGLRDLFFQPWRGEGGAAPHGHSQISLGSPRPQLSNHLSFGGAD